MAVDFKSLEEYYENNKKVYEKELKTIDDLFVDARDSYKNPTPIYSTKCRVKNIQSAYLKLKRKEAKAEKADNKEVTIDTIKDYAGMRVLCLFERDILDVYEFTLQLMKKKGYNLHEIEFYNIDTKYENKLLNKSKSIDEDYLKIIERKHKDSGYKSIHFLYSLKLNNKEFYIEIQLRTLFQDIWGELEHSIIYKHGYVNPYISNEFKLLANQLQIDDDRVSALKDMSLDEKIEIEKSDALSGPTHFLSYEDCYLPKLFTKDNSIKLIVDKFIKFLSDNNLEKLNKNIVDLAFSIYQQIIDKITTRDREEDKMLESWCFLEKHFFDFYYSCSDKDALKLEDVFNKYKVLSKSKDDSDRYAVHYRLGEIYFQKNDFYEAFKSFDESESLLETCPKIRNQTEDMSWSQLNYLRNKYQIKQRLAILYWRLGRENLNVTLKKIHEAEEISLIIKNQDAFPLNKEYLLLNNLCYYNIEKYIYRKSEEKESNYIVAKRYYEKLIAYKKRIHNEKKNVDENKNINDTIAWFCYQTYLKGDDKTLEYLKEALRIVNLPENAGITSTIFVSFSNNLRYHHKKLILSASKYEGILNSD